MHIWKLGNELHGYMYFYKVQFWRSRILYTFYILGDYIISIWKCEPRFRNNKDNFDLLSIHINIYLLFCQLFLFHLLMDSSRGNDFLVEQKVKPDPS